MEAAREGNDVVQLLVENGTSNALSCCYLIFYLCGCFHVGVNTILFFLSNFFVFVFLCVVAAVGATVNAITEETQETALTLACCGGLLDVSRYLLDHSE